MASGAPGESPGILMGRRVQAQTDTAATDQTPALPAGVDCIIRLPEVRRITGHGKSTIYRKLAEPRPAEVPQGAPLPFPEPVDLGENAVGWWLSEVMAYARSLPRRRLSAMPDAAE